MVGKQDRTPQLSIFDTPLERFINLEHELCILSKKIDWDTIEQEFSVYYSEIGRPSVPIRRMIGLLLLKHIYNLSDEAIVDRWIENPYWQYFSGEKVFQTQKPFDPTEFIHFRNRIGKAGAEQLLKVLIQLFGKEAQEKEVLIDSTVQEKNITYPTDAKLHKRVIDKVNKIAKQEGIVLRQTYTRTLKQLLIDQRFHSHPKRRKKARAALRKIKTIAGRQVRDIERQFTDNQKEKYQELFIILNEILSQQKGDKNKIYSIHEPEVSCIAKGKEAKKFEFGNKTGIVLTKTTKIVVGAIAFENNPYDGHTLEEHLKQTEYLTGRTPKIGIVDRVKKPGRLTILGQFSLTSLMYYVSDEYIILIIPALGGHFDRPLQLMSLINSKRFQLALFLSNFSVSISQLLFQFLGFNIKEKITINLSFIFHQYFIRNKITF